MDPNDVSMRVRGLDDQTQVCQTGGCRDKVFANEPALKNHYRNRHAIKFNGKYVILTYYGNGFLKLDGKMFIIAGNKQRSAIRVPLLGTLTQNQKLAIVSENVDDQNVHSCDIIITTSAMAHIVAPMGAVVHEDLVSKAANVHFEYSVEVE